MEQIKETIDELRQKIGALETERQQAEQAALEANAALRETQRCLTRLIESSPDAIISTDKQGNVVLFSEGAETLLGYRAKEVTSRNISVLYGDEAGPKQIAREMRKRGGSVSCFESVLLAKDGSNIPVLISASVLSDDKGEEAGTIGFVRDLRERKREEEERDERATELKAGRDRFQYLLTVTPGVVYTTQASGDYACTSVSENLDAVMGFSPWEMIEEPGFWVSRLHPDDAPRILPEIESLIRQGGGTTEYRLLNRDRNYIWIRDTFRVIRDDRGRPLEIVGSWSDISYHKQAEQALGERMAVINDLQAFVAASPAVIYTTTQTSDGFACRFVSESLESTTGYLPGEMRDNPKFWAKHVHPEDASRVFDEVKRLIGQGGGTVEYRFRHKRGDYVWIQDNFRVTPEKAGKPKEIVGSWANITDRKNIEAALERLSNEVERRNQFIREAFGRYLTDEVVSNVLESPTGLELKGEKRTVTMMMADLRGFTSLSERLVPERVVAILNRYLTAMVPIIKQYQGTIDEIIGDAIFVIFGAPIWQEDDAQRAVACAIAMQLAMSAVNEQNREADLPEVEMGIGIHTGPVVVGNVGSSERMKYGVVGSHVNLTSRIQSYSTGGQILISGTGRREVGHSLKIGTRMEVKAKGFERPVTVYEAMGIGAPHKLYLPESVDTLAPLTREVSFTYEIVQENHLGEENYKGTLTKLSPKGAEVRLEKSVPNLSDLKMHLVDPDGQAIPGALYAKVIGAQRGDSEGSLIRFTSSSPEIETFLRVLSSAAAEADQARMKVKNEGHADQLSGIRLGIH
jgi:PAS domain S-box-containing protein